MERWGDGAMDAGAPALPHQANGEGDAQYAGAKAAAFVHRDQWQRGKNEAKTRWRVLLTNFTRLRVTNRKGVAAAQRQQAPTTYENSKRWHRLKAGSIGAAPERVGGRAETRTTPQRWVGNSKRLPRRNVPRSTVAR